MMTSNKAKTLRISAILLCMVFMITMFSACGEKPGDNVGTTNPSSNDKPEQTVQPTPATESEIFILGVTQVLQNAVENSGKMSSAQLDSLLNPAAQTDEAQLNYSKIAIELANPDSSSENATITTESILDASNGNTSMTVDIKSGSEVAQNAGLYFVDNTMLLKRGDVEKPMIQYSMDPQIAESYADLPAIERFSRILAGSNTPNLQADDWTGEIDAYMQVIAENTQDMDFSGSEETVSLAGVSTACTSSTLSLTGESAVVVTRDLLTLIAQDPSFNSYFNSSDASAEGELALTGLDGCLRDLDAFTTEEKAAMNISFKLIQTDQPIGISVFAATGEKTFSLELLFYENGYVRQDNIIFKGFDNSSVTMREQNASAGGDNYTGQITYEVQSPGGQKQTNSTVTTQSTVTEKAYNATTQLTYEQAATADMSGISVTGSMNYSQQRSASGISGNGTGAITYSSDGESTSMNLAVVLIQSNDRVSVSAPEFLAASGVSVSDEAGLYAALGDNFDAETFTRAPASTRMLSSILMLFL